MFSRVPARMHYLPSPLIFCFICARHSPRRPTPDAHRTTNTAPGPTENGCKFATDIVVQSDPANPTLENVLLHVAVQCDLANPFIEICAHISLFGFVRLGCTVSQKGHV